MLHSFVLANCFFPQFVSYGVSGPFLCPYPYPILFSRDISCQTHLAFNQKNIYQVLTVCQHWVLLWGGGAKMKKKSFLPSLNPVGALEAYSRAHKCIVVSVVMGSKLHWWDVYIWICASAFRGCLGGMCSGDLQWSKYFTWKKCSTAFNTINIWCTGFPLLPRKITTNLAA